MTVLERFLEGDQSALSRIISFIEDREDGYRELLSKLYRRNGTALKIGFTGPPGAGKSSLVNNCAKFFANNGHKVAVIAVDPSSPFTGGALLGDRVRLTDLPMDGTVYIRSMATRGSSGGLAATTNSVAVALDAFGFDYILIETVGVGQVELDIVDTCDAVCVVLVPESGDAIQALKAGLMEIANIFVVNKADRPGSDNFMAQLNMILDIKRDKSDWELPIIDTIAIKNINTDKLIDLISQYLDYKKRTGLFDTHRRQQIEKKIYNILQDQITVHIRNKLGQVVDLTDIVNDIYLGNTDPYTAAEKLIQISNLKD
ncbi:MAG: methylmalonyl Co-A mutase-associated GTPase MeaB [Candidatus Zixiibacteriota bacterium]